MANDGCHTAAAADGAMDPTRSTLPVSGVYSLPLHIPATASIEIIRQCREELMVFKKNWMLVNVWKQLGSHCTMSAESSFFWHASNS